MTSLPDANNVYGVLRHDGGVPGITWRLIADGWAVRNASWYEREVRCDWFEVVLSPEPGGGVLLAGRVDPRLRADLAALLRATGATVSLELDDEESRRDDALLGWAVVANVRETTAVHDGTEERSGTKHFSPGTKVWVLPSQWGDGGENVMVVGRHRGGRGLVRMVVARRHLTSFRAAAVYSPAVHDLLTKPWHHDGVPAGRWANRADAEEAAAYWNGSP